MDIIVSGCKCPTFFTFGHVYQSLAQAYVTNPFIVYERVQLLVNNVNPPSQAIIFYSYNMCTCEICTLFDKLRWLMMVKFDWLSSLCCP